MKFTDLFIRRPVLASVVSLLILVLGLRALATLPVRQYPKTRERRRHRSPRSTTAPIRRRVAGFITTPLENAIAQANGIDYMTSTSQSGVSTITVISAAELRRRQGADRDQHQGQLGAEPAAHRHAAAGADGQGRPDHRRDVHRLQQRRPGAQPDHRLPRARRAAEAAGGAGRADGRAAGRARTSRCAPGSIRRSSPPTASPPPTCRRRWRRTTTSRASATPRARWCRCDLTASTDLHSLEEFRKLVLKQQAARSCG